MKIMLAGILGGGQIVLVLAMALVLFGARKLPELAKGLGQSIKEFKKATQNASEGMHEALETAPGDGSKRLPPATAFAKSEQAIPQALPIQKS